MSDQISELNKLYNETINVSYFSSLLTPRTQKKQSYENTASKFIEYISNHPELDKNNKISMYDKIITLYEYIDSYSNDSSNSIKNKNVIKYKLERYSILTNEELTEELGNIKEIEIIKLLDDADSIMKIKLYKYLIENLKLKTKYLETFVDYISSLIIKIDSIDQEEQENKENKEYSGNVDEFIPYIQELYKLNLGSIDSRKYADLLILYCDDKNKFTDYCCKTDPLPSNIDYYKSL